MFGIDGMRMTQGGSSEDGIRHQSLSRHTKLQLIKKYWQAKKANLKYRKNWKFNTSTAIFDFKIYCYYPNRPNLWSKRSME